MNVSVLMNCTKISIKLYKQQNGCKKSLKTVEKLSQDIQEFENNLNVEHQKMIKNCPYCKINMQSFSHIILECPKCGLADTKKSYYHELSQSYLEQPFAKHFAEWINNILGKITPKKYCTKTT